MTCVQCDGLKGVYGAWDWEVSLARIASEGDKAGVGADRTGFIQAITSGEYKIGGVNSQALLDKMFKRTSLYGKTSQNVLDGKVTGELFNLPAGPAQAAFGFEHRDEDVSLRSSKNLLDAQILSRGSLLIEGSRRLDAAFGEVEAPIVSGLTANGALRYDRASGFDGHVSPKIGLRLELSPRLMFRGTVAEGFRAPNIPETQGKVGLTGFFNSTVDPRRCATATRIRDILNTGNASDKQEAQLAYNSGCLVSLPAMISSNPELKPEQSKSYTFGFVLEPSPAFSATFDYFKIERYEEISYRDPDYVLAREGQPGYSQLISRAAISGEDISRAARANELNPSANISWAAGQLTTLLLQYENFGKTESSGIDIDMRGKLALQDSVALNIRFAATYMISLRAWDIDAGAYRPNTVGLRNSPRWRGVLSSQWSKGDWATGLRFNYTSRTALNNDETDEATWGEAGCQSRLKPGSLPCFISDSVRTDLNFSYKGFRDTLLLVNVNNVTGEPAPVNLRDGFTRRPRTLKLEVQHKFF